MQKSTQMTFGKYVLFYLFLGLKSHSGHRKSTSQNACLEVHTTVSKDSRAKKRFGVLRMAKNATFGAKHYCKLQKTAIFWQPQHRKSFFGFRIFRNGRMDF